jgi:hypothetical protein
MTIETNFTMSPNKKIRIQNLAVIARVVAFTPMTAPEIAMVVEMHPASVKRMLRLDREDTPLRIVGWALRCRRYTAMFGISDHPDAPRPARKTSKELYDEYTQRLKVDADLQELRRITWTKQNARRRPVKVRDPLLAAFYGK